MPIMMLVVCRKRELNAIVEEFGDWQSAGVQVKLYGITEKASEGFVLLEWSQPIPEYFFNKLKNDVDVLDVLTFDPLFRPVPV
jgi:hypothetical protein